MRFGVLASIIALEFVTSAAFGGGPDVRCKSAAVESVVADESKILMVVSGRSELFLSDSKLPPREGSAKFVETDMEHCPVTLVRRDSALEGMGFKSWKDCCDKATALKGQKAWLDMQGSVMIDSAQLMSVHATAYGFAAPEASVTPTVHTPATERAIEAATHPVAEGDERPKHMVGIEAKVNTPVVTAQLTGDWEMQPGEQGDFKEKLRLGPDFTGTWHQSKPTLPITLVWFVEGSELRLEYYHDPHGDFNWRVKTLMVSYQLERDTLTLKLDGKTSKWVRAKEKAH